MSRACDGLQCLLSFYFQENDALSTEDRNAIIHVLGYVIRLEPKVDPTDYQALIKSVFKYHRENLTVQAVTSIFKIFFNEGIHLNAESEMLQAILNLAKRHSSSEVAAFLMTCGDSCAETVLCIILNKYNEAEDVQRQEYAELIRVLVSKGTDVHKTNQNGVTPLNVAVTHKLMVVLEIFDKSGVDFSSCNENGNSLHFLSNMSSDSTAPRELECRWVRACKFHKKGYVVEPFGEPSNDESFNEIIDFSVLHGCDVNAKDKKGDTPLHYALEHRKNGIAKRLIMHGANVNRRSGAKVSFTPLHVAVLYNNNVEMIETLVNAGAEINVKDAWGRGLLNVINSNDCKVTRMLLKMGAHFDVRDEDGYLPLETACKTFFFEMVTELLKAGADINDSVEFVVEERFQCCRLEFGMTCFIGNHLMKLRAAGLFVDNRLQLFYRDSYDDDRTEYNIYLKEVEVLKKYAIGTNTSLYDFMRMHPIAKCAYLENTKLVGLVNSPKLEEKFPNYHVLIMGSFNGTVRRREMLKPGRDVWYELTNVHLPDVCVMHILSYLSNSQLRAFIEGASDRSFRRHNPLPI